MANVFGQHGLSTGNNDGTSWEDAYQTIGAFLAGLSNNDVGYFKEHAGADLTTGSEFSWVYDTVTIYFGMPSSHTGTNTTTTGRTGYTRFYSNSSHDFRFAFFYGTSSNSLYIDRLWLYDFHKTSFEGAGIQSFNHGSTTFRNCIFDTCTATSGGALSWSTDNTTDSIDIFDTRFVNCEGYDGAAVKVNNAELTMVNCSIVNCDNNGTANSIVGLSNQTLASFVGLTMTDCTSTNVIGGTRSLYVANSIIYGNTGTITAADGSSFIYSDIDATIGGTGHTTTGLIDTDPSFIGTGDYPEALSASSPSSVTSGGNTGVTGYVATDYLGVSRDSSPSMGAFEYVVSANGITIAGSFSAPTGAVTFSQANAAAIAGAFSAPTLAADFAQVNEVTVAGLMPVPSLSLELSTSNAMEVAGFFSAPAFVSDFAQANVAAVAGMFSVPSFVAEFAQANALALAGEFPAPVVSGDFSQTVTMSAAGTFPAPSFAAEFERAIEATFAGTFPVPVGSVEFTLVAVNPMSVEGSFPVPVGTMTASQIVEMVVAGVFPAPEGYFTVIASGVSFPVRCVLTISPFGGGTLRVLS